MADGGTMGGHGHGMAQLDLLPVGADGIAPQATHVAVGDGDWFDPATWSSGEVPGEGAIVQIPEGVTVTYEGASEADLFIVRVDGTLNMTANDGVETVMSVDTMITSMSSTLNIMANRATDGTVDIVFTEAAQADIPAAFGDVSAGDGVLGRSSWDPEQLSLGLVASGEVNIRGQETLGHMQLEEGPAAGATELVFDSNIPLSYTWQPGDQIVIGGTSYQGRDGPGATLVSQDEVRTIVSVESDEGRLVVTLDRPLDHDHVGPPHPDTGAELTGFVANLTRNVTFSSAVADQDGDGLVDRPVSTAAEAGPLDHTVAERGHIMFMHNDNVTMADSAMYGLGRTDKSRGVDDFQVVKQGSNNHRLYEDTNGNGQFDEGIDQPVETAPEEITNMRGRYALHIHEAGTGGHGDHGDHHAGHEHEETDAGDNAGGPCPITGADICRCADAEDTDGDGIPDCDNHSGGAEIVGNVVWGSPGWGYVHHSSVADLIDNVAFDVAGSAFVAEQGDEVGTWSHNAAFSTYGGRDDFGNDDSDDMNEDGGFEGNGFYLKSRLIDVEDNAAISSARAGFFWHTNGAGLRDTDADQLGELGVLAKGGDTVESEDVPIRTFEGNTTIAAYEGLRMISDPTDAVRKFNDAWSHMKDFVAYEVDESGVSVTYSSKYIFENFLLLGTEVKQTEGIDTNNSGFFLKASVSDITIIDSHVENFLNAYTDWAQVGDRQEYRRGFWDPKRPSDVLDREGVPVTEGIGYEHGIENPIYNLWNINLVDVTWANISGAAKIRVPSINFTDENGTTQKLHAREVFKTDNAMTSDDPDADQPLEIKLIDDSAAGGLVALWREDIANHPDQAAMLQQHVPLAYRENAYLGQIHWAGGGVSKRAKYTDYVAGINNDIWSGTILEFEKLDSLGRHVFAYDDFGPMNADEQRRAVTTNERIVFSKEDIDAALLNDGYYHLDGASDMKFVEVTMLFTDRMTGVMETRAFLVALDMAWEIPEDALALGIYTPREDSVVADQYAWFEEGVLREDLDMVRPQFDMLMIDTPSGDVPVLSPFSDAARAGVAEGASSAQGNGDGQTGGDGDDIIAGSGAKDTIDGGGGNDLLIGVGGDDVLRGGAGDDDLRGGNGADLLEGGDGQDVLIGGNQNDSLDGGAGDDMLNGGHGDDVLNGGDGDDVIVGQSGTNVLTGGSGADRFVYGGWSHDDRITDFEAGIDALDLLVQGLGFGDLEIEQVGGDTRISYDTGWNENTITLEGVDASDVTEDIFNFS